MKKKESTKFLKLCLAEALIRMMQEQSYESINISAVCERAGVGRTTYYRHFDTKGGKEELLVFKLVSEWQAFAEKHREEKEKDWTKVFLGYVYENRELLRLMYRSGLVTAIMRAFDELSTGKRKRTPLTCAPFSCTGFSAWSTSGSDTTSTKRPNRSCATRRRRCCMPRRNGQGSRQARRMAAERGRGERRGERRLSAGAEKGAENGG